MWLYRSCWLFLKSGPRKAQCLYRVTVSLSFPISSRADHTIISPLFLSSHILTPFSLLSSPPYHLLSCQPPYCPLLPHFSSMLSFKAFGRTLVVSFSSSNIMPVLQSVLISTRENHIAYCIFIFLDYILVYMIGPLFSIFIIINNTIYFIYLYVSKSFQ